MLSLTAFDNFCECLCHVFPLAGITRHSELGHAVGVDWFQCLSRAGLGIFCPARLFFFAGPPSSRDMLDKSCLNPGRLPVVLDPADLPGVQPHQAADLGLG